MSPTTVAVLTSWSLQPAVIAGLLLTAGLYAAGWRRLQRHSRTAVLPAWRPWCYFLGLATVALALLSPIATFGAALFFVHMIEHLLLLLVAPPLLWLGAPLLPILWAFPRQERLALGRLFQRGHPVHRVCHVLTDARVAAPIFLLTVGVWHLPGFYDAAEGTTVTHGLEHALFFATALLYWWPVVHPTGGRRRLGYGMSLLYLFLANVEGIVIGAPLTFANHVLYTYYAQVPRVMSLSALADQQLGGLLMWVAPHVLWLVVLQVILLRWFKAETGNEEEIERTYAARQSAPLAAPPPDRPAA